MAKAIPHCGVVGGGRKGGGGKGGRKGVERDKLDSAFHIFVFRQRANILVIFHHDVCPIREKEETKRGKIVTKIDSVSVGLCSW